jgi:phosphohistidine swiveling domain-containing protein
MNKRYNSDEWYVWEQNASPMLLIMTLNPSFQNLREYLGSCLFNTLVVFETDDSNNYQAKWIFRYDEGRILGQKMVDLLICPPYMVAFNSGVEVSEEKLIRKAREIQENVISFKAQDISAIFDEFAELFYDYYRFGAFTEPVQWHTEFILSNYLNKHYTGDLTPAEALKLLLVTETDSFTVDILRDMRECAAVLDAVVNNDGDIKVYIKNNLWDSDFANKAASYILSHESAFVASLKGRLEKHSKQYYWKSNNYYSTRYVTPAEVLIELLDSQHFQLGSVFGYYDGLMKTIEDSKKKQLEQKQEVFKTLPTYYQNIVSIANSVGATLIDNRKKNVMTCNSAFDALLSVVAKETETTLENLHLLIPQELKYYVDEPKSYIERFEQRKKLFICLQTDFPLADELIEAVDANSPDKILAWKVTLTEEPFIAEGAVAEQALEKLNLRMNLFESSSTDVEKLQGVTAFYDVNKSIIEGVVRVIKNPKIEILESGEILVAPSTTPDFISAINKCTAIIADWGGQASHAAIVARELKKPCIIGTNFASQILRSGQRIKLDFLQGTIEVVG